MVLNESETVPVRMRKARQKGLRDMAENRLKNCSVLVVDDSAASRTLVATTLHDIGIGYVNTVPHGAAAIDYLQHSALSSMNGPTPPVDLVISEWDMEPVGGMMLMNWLRRSLDSPDRFMRAAIMSGALDMEKVEHARACGVNAVFSKPFTIGGLKKHVTSVVESNPAFFKTPTYFGPDRRRRKVDMVLNERRLCEHPHSLVLGVGDDVDVGCFDLPNYLDKVLDGAQRMRMDYSQRHAAHEQLSPYGEDYADWIRQEVAMLRLALRTAEATPTMRTRNLAVMNSIVVKLEREAHHMDYPLISALAHTLKIALKVDVRLWRDTAEIINAGIKGLEMVVRDRIRGAGGALGVALNENLSLMDQKLLRLAPVVNARRRGVTLARA